MGVVEGVSYLIIDYVSLSLSMQMAIVIIPASLVLLWFTRKAASISFLHLVSMVALGAVFAIPGNVIPSHIILRFLAPTPVVLSAILAIGRLSTQASAVWVLVKAHDYQQIQSNQIIRAVTVMILVIALWAIAGRWEHVEFLVDVHWIKRRILPTIPTLIAIYGVIVLISYILRRRYRPSSRIATTE